MRFLPIVLATVFIVKSSFSQQKKAPSKAKDTLKTEVINVTTSYKPKVTDAFKIKQNPSIKLSEKSKKKKLNYSIFSVPVASTFVPKSGTLKAIYLSRKELFYDNYLALGFGNNKTPFLEAFVNGNISDQSNWGIYAKYISSDDGVKDTDLDSSFSNMFVSLHYGQTERYFDWHVGLNFQRNSYNWYGLPGINFNNKTLDAINSKQTYNFIQPTAEINFDDSFINSAKLSASYFYDGFKSKEYSVQLQPEFELPLSDFISSLENLFVDVSVDYLKGEFSKSYENTTAVKYNFITFAARPTYLFKYEKLNLKLGAKVYYLSDIHNKSDQFFVYPDVNASYPIMPFINLYAGASGDLHANSYKNYSDKNPYLSPNLFITQTNEKYNFFGGFNGKAARNISYDVKVSYKNEEDKPLFSINNSKSDGTSTSSKGVNLLGYEYGNSLNVIYDDVETFSVFSQVEIEVSNNFTFGANGQANYFQLRNQMHAWNLPKIKGEFFGRYNTEKWYLTSHIFFVGNRKDVLYSGTFPSTFVPKSLKGYLDLNLNGGYHFSDHISAFIKLENLLNNRYRRFENFYVQGLQVLCGATWKFDL